jgi:hypothetical protein
MAYGLRKKQYQLSKNEIGCYGCHSSFTHWGLLKFGEVKKDFG